MSQENVNLVHRAFQAFSGVDGYYDASEALEAAGLSE
jgi:hypothetical protein